MADEIKGYTSADVGKLLGDRGHFSSKQYYLKEALRNLGNIESEKLDIGWSGTEIRINLPRHRDAIRQCLIIELDYVTAKIKEIDDYCQSLPRMPGVE